MATVSTDSSEPMRRVMEIPGFELIRVSSLVAVLGDGQAFKCGWVVSLLLGLAPRPAQQRWSTGFARYQQAQQPLSVHHADSRYSFSIEDR